VAAGGGVVSVAAAVGVRVNVIVSSSMPNGEKLIGRESARRARAESGAMWYLVTHLVFLGLTGAVLGFLGFPELMMPVSPLGIFLATALTLLTYHLLSEREEDVSFDIILCLIADLSVLVFSPSIYAFWFAEKGVPVWLWWDRLITARSLLVSMAIVVLQALLPLVYIKYVRIPVYAELPPLEAAEGIKPAGRVEVEAVAAQLRQQYRPYTIERLEVPEIAIALDASGRPVYSLEEKPLLTPEERVD